MCNPHIFKASISKSLNLVFEESKAKVWYMTDKIVCWKHFHRQMICFGGFMINQSSGRNFFGYKFFDDCSVSFSFLATCYLFCIPPLYICFFFFIWDAVQLCQRRPVFVATLATPHTLVGIFCIFRKIWLF